MEGNDKPVTLYDTSSASQPLLSEPPPPGPRDEDRPESESSQYLQISYNYSHRAFKDIPFLVLFLFLALSTFAFGLFSVFHRNAAYSDVSSFVYDSNSTACVAADSVSSFVLHLPTVSSSSSVVKDLIWTLVITLVLSLPICLFLLFSLKHYPKHLVYASIPFFIVIPIFFNVYWFVACTVSSSCSEAFPLGFRILAMVFVFVVIGVFVWIIVANWHRIELTVSIIGVASNALSKNLGLFVVLPSLTFALLVYFAPIVVFLVFARRNGSVVPRESSGEYSCVWKQDGWVPAYYTLAILTMLWSTTAMIEAQVFVISGTIAQWYFEKDEDGPKRSIRSSLRHAFGPSSGTVCFSGLLITAVRMVRAVVDSARQEDAHGFVNLALRCCVNALLSAVDFLNKFTINFAAITGEAYCSSARMTYELLRRNLMSAVFVETISSRLLGGIVFVLSAIYAIATWGILKGVTNLGGNSYFVAAMAWVLLIVVLGFFVHVLDNVIETVYVCYAIDRDRGDVCKQEVHEVYVHLPITRNHDRQPPSSSNV